MDHLQRSRLNLFSSRTLDRAVFLRPAEVQLAEIINGPSSRFVPVLDTNVLVNPENARCSAGLLAAWELRECFGHCDEPIYLGQGDGTHYFAVVVDNESARAGEFAAATDFEAAITSMGGFLQLRTVRGSGPNSDIQGTAWEFQCA